MSTARLHLCKRLAAITAMLEEIEGKHIAGERIDLNAYLPMVNAATRLSNTLGLNRKQKKVPSIQDYIASHASRTIEHEADDD